MNTNNRSYPGNQFGCSDLRRLCLSIRDSSLMEKESLYSLLESNLPEVYRGVSIKKKRALKAIGRALACYIGERFGPIDIGVGYSKEEKQICIDVSKAEKFLTTSEATILKEIVSMFFRAEIGLCLITKDYQNKEGKDGNIRHFRSHF